VIVVCAHPARELDPRLAAIADQVVWDTDGVGSNRNHARAWRAAANTDAPWTAVVEDDAIPVDDCLTQLPAMLSHAPTRIVSAYLGSGRPEKYQPAIRDALARDPQWIISTDLLHHVAVFTTPQLALQFADLLDSSPWPCDSAIGFWARKNRHPISYCVPSLFDHSDPQPLITDRHVTEVPRHAWRTGGRDWSGDRVEFLNQQAETMYRGLLKLPSVK